MAKAMFKCPQCKSVRSVRFKIGNEPKAPLCGKCNVKMKRQFVQIDIGEVVKDEMLELGQKMLYE